MSDVKLISGDLAPGDGASGHINLPGMRVRRVLPGDAAGPADFVSLHKVLWEAFGRHGGMEELGVLQRRCGWPAHGPRRYEMLAVEVDGQLAAVRDHTAMVMESADDGGVPEVLVHLSHALVLPAFRRTGLAGWLRALPVQAARALRPGGAVTLLAEMQPLDRSDPASVIRLTAYQRAGFLKIDPALVPYVQPDFRPAEEIDATGGPRLHPYWLLVRQVGREAERTITGARLRRMVETLYAMYAQTFRPEHMRTAFKTLHHYPPAYAVLTLQDPLT